MRQAYYCPLTSRVLHIAAAQQLIQPDRPQLAFHQRLLVQFGLSLASGGGLIRALDTLR
jgi:hypothetical protein